MKAMKRKKEPPAPVKTKAKAKTTVEHTEAPPPIKRENLKEHAKILKTEQSKFTGWAKYNSSKDESVAKALEVALTNWCEPATMYSARIDEIEWNIGLVCQAMRHSAWRLIMRQHDLYVSD